MNASTAVIFFAPLLLAGLALLAVAVRGRRLWSAPYCRSCKYDLRGIVLEEHPDCPECGADLTASSAIHFGRAKTHWPLMVFVLLLWVWPFVAHRGVAAYERHQAEQTLASLGVTLSTVRDASLDAIVAAMPDHLDEIWLWQELDIRLGRGDFTAEHIEQVLQALEARFAADLQEKGEPQRVPWSGRFMEQLAADARVTDARKVAFARAYFGAPSSSDLPRFRETDYMYHQDMRIRYGSAYASEILGLRMYVDLQSVSFDGQTIVSRLHGASATHRYYFVEGMRPGPGKHTIEFVIKHALIPTAAAEGLRLDATSEQWARVASQWTATCKTEFHVLAQGEVGAELAVDESIREQMARSLRLAYVRVRPTDGGVTVQRKFAVEPDLPMAISADIVMLFEDQRVPLGAMIAHQHGDKADVHESPNATVLGSVPASVTHVDILLKPAPQYADRFADISKVWGEAMLIKRVPLERLDLEGTNAPPTPE